MSSRYEYCAQLLALDSCAETSKASLPKILNKVVTPLKVHAWERELAAHPDQEFAAYILKGIKQGFRIGFNRSSVQLRCRQGNMHSASEQPEVVENYLQEESRAGRVIHIPSQKEAEELGIHYSPFGVIPKKGKPDKWRLILDLSAPEGHSVNDGISKELASLSYVSVDQVVSAIRQRGRGSLMAKMDIKHAYRNVPVHPKDRLILGMQWKGSSFVDAALPFGLRSAPLLFTAVADAVQFIMEKWGVGWVAHYIDDFITVGSPESTECTENVRLMHSICDQLGLPIELSKDVGPSSILTFLGIELDSNRLELRLPREKLQQLRSNLAAWRGRKAGRKRDLLSLIGSLSHACKVVRAGRSFLRRLIDLASTAKCLDHYVRMNLEARADVEWWVRYAESWNGISMMHIGQEVPPEVTVTSDASGTWGCGAYSGEHWFMLKWSGSLADYHITIKELIPVVIAAVLWGQSWRGKSILIQCDNMAVVHIINQGSSKNKVAMHLARCLSFTSAMFNFHLSAQHIKGADNTLADALSRDNLPLFHSLHPQAEPVPTPIPAAILDPLVLLEPNWTCRNWTEQWTSIFKMV